MAFRHQMLQCYNVLSGTILKANFEDIRQVLLETIEGRPILGALDSGSIISLAQRRCMVRILVSHMVNRFGETPTADTKMALSSTLIETFPSLRDMSESGCVTWYSKGRHHRRATGFLEERLRNIRKRMRRLSDAGPRRVEQPPPQRTIPDSSMPLEQVVEMAEWLKHNDQPLIQVEEFMRDTALYGARWVRENSGKSVHDVLQEFPQLTTPGMDFQTIHPDSAMRLYQTWTPELEEKVLNMAAIERKLQTASGSPTLVLPQQRLVVGVNSAMVEKELGERNFGFDSLKSRLKRYMEEKGIAYPCVGQLSVHFGSMSFL
ncbi:hypothetical protein N1851_026988 [Merluccius polli]|uniref:Uncharacterized protein n=1 Tax=Merluccius polli TaxID=89951 RepID=A0AA47NSI5_MERPO|nr:hypothetical protein N1851_026988 [Merluccius polli]